MRVFSVPVSASFLRTVIAALVDGRLIDGFKPGARPADLAQATLYLPTRRAGRMAREIFLDELKTDAVVLPRIIALGDIDEDELAFAEQAEPYGGVAPLDVPPKLGELDRRLTLARLGSPGWMPAPAKFLHAVAALAQGAVVLPGLDTALDDDAWQLIGGVRDAQGKFIQPPASSHPQFAMQALLHRLGIRRGDVERLSEPAAHGRDVLASEAMRPSNATAEWHRRLAEADIADKNSRRMKNLAGNETPKAQKEAPAI